MTQWMKLSIVAALLSVAACPPFPPMVSTGGTTQSTAQVVTGTGGGVQYLYVPTTDIPIASIQQVIVQSNDGRTFTLGPTDVQAVASGRVALAIPPGVTQGEVTIVTTSGASAPIPFYIAQPMTTLVTTTTVVGAQCYDISGTWTGNISESDPDAVATATIQLGADCVSLSGFIHWQGPRIGSVDSTIAGQWDASTMTLVARDTQLFNVRPTPGGGFCPTEQYRLTLSPDGRTLTGLNIVTERTCAGQSSVYLQR
jgi:hypothetical protein